MADWMEEVAEARVPGRHQNRPRRRAAWRLTAWTCETCGNENKRERGRCRRCGRARSLKSTGGGK